MTLTEFRAMYPYKPYQWYEGIGEVMSYPFIEDDHVWVYAREIKDDPTSARYVCVGTSPDI